jgi:hypothetical protein
MIHYELARALQADRERQIAARIRLRHVRTAKRPGARSRAALARMVAALSTIVRGRAVAAVDQEAAIA